MSKKFKIILSISLFLLIVLVISHFVTGSPFSFPFLDWFFNQDFAGTEMTREDAYGLSLTGMEIVARVGDKFEGENREKGWMDGQIVDIRPLGFHTGKFARQHFAVIELPNINYWDLRGSKDWKSTATSTKELKKYLTVTDTEGNQRWEEDYSQEKQVERKRDYFIDFRWLLDKGYITKDQYFDIYDRDKTHDQISLDITSIEQLFSHEDKKERLARLEDRRTWTLVKNTINRFIPTAQAITSGTYSIGSSLDYDTVTLFEAAIEAQLTGNLTGEHNDEETSISGQINFDVDTANYLLKLTAQSGDEHNGGAYGNGARIKFGAANDYLRFDESVAGIFDDLEISNLAIDASGDNTGLRLSDGGDDGQWLINRIVVKGDAYTNGIRREGFVDNYLITNNIVYGCGIGIEVDGSGSATSGEVYNNTSCKNVNNFRQPDATLYTSLTFKNNLAQGDIGGSDYADAGAGFGTTGYNISEDATSPDAAYRNKEVSFVDEANDDYHLASSDTEAKNAGENLYSEGGFSDDIDGDQRPASNWDIGADQNMSATEFVSTIMEGTVGDYHSLFEWEAAVDCDLTASSTRVYSFDAPSGWVSDGASVSTDSGASTATLIHAASSSQALLIDIQGSFDDNDEVTDGSNNFTLSNNGAPAIATAKIDGAWSNADQTAVTIDDWTTATSTYIRIYTTETARHNGKWDTSKYRLEVSNAAILSIDEDYVRVEGLQIRLTSQTSTYRRLILVSTIAASNEIRISHNIIRGFPTSTVDGQYGIDLSDADIVAKIWNNIVYDVNGSSIFYFGIRSSNSGSVYVYNNTVYNCEDGFSINVGTVVAKNNITQDCNNGYSGTFDSSSDYNISDIAGDQPDSGSHDKMGVEVLFADEANDDFHLAGSDTAARDAGVDLSGDSNLAFDDDIDGEGRGAGGAWDIGADEKKRSTVINAPLTNKLTDGLVGHWTFNGQDMDWASTTAEVLDRSGNSNNGNVTNFDQTSVSRGKVGQALEFDGSNDYVDTGTMGSLGSTMASNAVAFSFWLKSSTTTSMMTIYGTYNDGVTTGFNFRVNSDVASNVNAGYVSIYTRGEGGHTSDVLDGDTGSDTGITDGNWHHLIIFIDCPNNVIKVYVDAVEQSFDYRYQNAPGMTDFQYGLPIGAYNLQGSIELHFNGVIDEVRVYDRALSADEITDLYQAGARKLGVNTPITQKYTSGLVGHWTFNGQDMDWASTTAEVLDRSGNSNNGNVTNFDQTSVARGQVGQALDFERDSSAEVVAITDSSSLSSLDVFTISAWINMESVNDGDQMTLVGHWNEFLFNIDTNGELQIDLASGSQYNGAVIPTGEWTHIAITIDISSGEDLYINGVYDSSGSITRSSVDGASEITIGARELSGYSQFFDGIIDEVRIYNRALSAEEVMDLYQAGAGRMKVK